MSTANEEARILSALASGPQRAEVLRAKLGIAKPLWIKATAALSANGKIKKSGEKRLTEYRLA